MPSNRHKRDLYTRIATCFGIGYFSPFPGTLGSALAFPFLPLIIFFSLSAFQILLVSCSLFVLGTYSCSRYESAYSLKDPKEVVVDEFVAQTIVFLCIHYAFGSKFDSVTISLLYLASFCLFRLFDIAKPWPINLVQKNIHGGFGVMLDDLLAAIITFIIITTVVYVSI